MLLKLTTIYSFNNFTVMPINIQTNKQVYFFYLTLFAKTKKKHDEHLLTITTLLTSIITISIFYHIFSDLWPWILRHIVLLLSIHTKLYHTLDKEKDVVPHDLKVQSGFTETPINRCINSGSLSQSSGKTSSTASPCIAECHRHHLYH